MPKTKLNIIKPLLSLNELSDGGRRSEPLAAPDVDFCHSCSSPV